MTGRKESCLTSLDGLVLPGPPPERLVGAFPNLGAMAELLYGFINALRSRQHGVPPPPTSLATLDLGTRHSPEGACLPFKLILGNLMECLEKGANTVGMLGERGPCRLGLYSLGMRLILSDLGQGVSWVDFDSVNLRQGYWKRFRDAYRRSGGHQPVWRIAYSGLVGFYRLHVVERLEAERNYILPLERETGGVNERFREGLKRIDQAHTLGELKRAHRAARRLLRSVPLDRKRAVVNVVVTGEIFCALDPFANFGIETRLGRLRARPHRVIWQTSHIRYYLGLDLFQPDGKRAAVRAARRFLPEQLGGDCNANVGHAILAARRGDDGMVHLKPFGCMLEFVAQNLMAAVERDTGIPILSLTLDDLTGEERINVRLEAFVDNLFRRRRDRERRAS
jgi:predicted nucleotide-binding protein (sugar kinase/HSP70/actin superfamily)